MTKVIRGHGQGQEIYLSPLSGLFLNSFLSTSQEIGWEGLPEMTYFVSSGVERYALTQAINQSTRNAQFRIAPDSIVCRRYLFIVCLCARVGVSFVYFQ